VPLFLAAILLASRAVAHVSLPGSVREFPTFSLPEPATLVVVGAGIVGLAVFSRRKRNGQ
jgi:hypothetical protein